MNNPTTPQREEDNTPVALPTGENNYVTPKREADGFDRTLWYTIGGIVLVSCCGIMLVVYLFSRTIRNNVFSSTSPFVGYTPISTFESDSPSASRPTPRPTSRSTPNKQATQMAWDKPPVSPTVGSSEEAQQALDANKVKGLRSIASYLPDIPRINQPGDIYYYGVQLDKSQPLFWDYTWCARSEESLDQNLKQMKVEFSLNADPVPPAFFAINDYKENDKSYCRMYTILITFWPQGIHLLESNITFLQPTNNGRSDYPAGAHTFQYRVTVKP